MGTHFTVIGGRILAQLDAGTLTTPAKEQAPVEYEISRRVG
jgi:hypothetical protein